MKKRILFVDDEQMVLQGIQRLLRPMRQEWEMEFAEGGEKATEFLAKAEYDVVVTDMMMPGMDGAQLLAYVKEYAPRTIRLVLSGHAEQHLAMKCVGIAHQYLAKPCDPAVLRKTVARVTDPAFAIRNEQVLTLVVQLDHLPSMPSVYSEMVRLLNDPDTSMEDVGAVIANDMALTAKILQIVNSSFFGLARTVSKPSEAAAFLGMETLKTLALATNVFGQFEKVLPKCYSAEEAAEHSKRVGAAARAIARCEQSPRAVVDECLLGGMLHDVGKLVLASSLPWQFEQAATAKHMDVLEAERAIFGATHADVGGYLLGLWGLPHPVVEAISHHHTPNESQVREFSALTATHAANCLIAEASPATDGEPDAALDLGYLEALGLAGRLPEWRAAVEEVTNVGSISN